MGTQVLAAPAACSRRWSGGGCIPTRERGDDHGVRVYEQAGRKRWVGAQTALSRVSGGGGVRGSAAEPVGDGSHAPTWEPGSLAAPAARSRRWSGTGCIPTRERGNERGVRVYEQ